MRGDARLFRMMAVIGLASAELSSGLLAECGRFQTLVIAVIQPPFCRIIGIFAHHLEYRQPARVFNSSRTYGCPTWVGNFRELFALTEMAG